MRRYRYHVSGRLVECPFPLTGLLVADDDRPADFRAAPMGSGAREAWPDTPPAAAAPRDFIRRCADLPGSWWLRTGNGESHRVHPETGILEVDERSGRGLALTHDIVDFALPNLLSCGDQIVLHGALLETEEGCVAALGESGVGKSTLAARWVRGGRRFMSDDWFVLRPEGERLVAYASHPSIRLRERDREIARCTGVEEIGPEPGFSKTWYAFGPGSACCSEPRDLRGVVFLRRAGNGVEETAVASPGSREAMAGLVSSLVLLEIDSHERWGFLLPLLSRIEARVRMEEIRISEGTKHLDEVVEAVEKLARGAIAEGLPPRGEAGRGADAHGR
jgi:hypothetical protein